MNSKNKNDIQNPPQSKSGYIKIIVVVFVLLVLILAINSCVKKRREKNDNIPVFEVQRGSLTISITESGSLSNKERIVIKNKVDGRTPVTWLIEEGTMVKEGDVMVELDSSELEAERLEHELKLENAKSSLIQAQETMFLAKSQAEADIEKAELEVKFTAMDVEKYTKGEYPQAIQQSDADITLAEEDLQRAEDKLEWSKKLSGKGYLTRTELQADELSVKKNKINLELAQGKQKVLKDYTHKKDLEKFQSDAKQAKMALERTKSKARASLAQAEAKLRAAESTYTQQEAKIKEVIEQLGFCKVKAPSDGMVIFAVEDGHWHKSREPLDVGQEVSRNQNLIYLPTSREMVSSISIQETSRTKVKEGMKTIIRVEALPGRIFDGKLTKIGILPDSSMAWLNPDLKVYKCEVGVDGVDDELRAGMNCSVEIIIEEYESAIQVPIQCVVMVKGKPTVYIQKWSGFEQREVSAGLDNNRMIHIVSGLEEGEKVMLAPPLDKSSMSNGKPKEKTESKGQSKPKGNAPTKKPGKKKHA